MLRKALLVTSFLLVPSATLAQSAVDLETLQKADVLMEKVRAADSSELLDLVAAFEPLVKTDGLSTECQTALSSMQALASMTVTTDAADEVPEEMRESLAAVQKAASQKLTPERDACLKAAETEKKSIAVGAADTQAPLIAQEQDDLPVRDRLIALRDGSKAAFEAEDAAKLAEHEAVLAVMGTDQDLDISCRLAATDLVRQIKQYGKALEAKDEGMKKIALFGVKSAGRSAESNIDQCE